MISKGAVKQAVRDRDAQAATTVAPLALLVERSCGQGDEPVGVGQDLGHDDASLGVGSCSTMACMAGVAAVGLGRRPWNTSGRLLGSCRSGARSMTSPAATRAQWPRPGRGTARRLQV